MQSIEHEQIAKTPLKARVSMFTAPHETARRCVNLSLLLSDLETPLRWLEPLIHKPINPRKKWMPYGRQQSLRFSSASHTARVGASWIQQRARERPCTVFSP